MRTGRREIPPLPRSLIADRPFLQDLLVYSESTESGLRADNAHLLQQIRDLELDLSADTRSRRDLQQQLQQLEARHQIIQQENNALKVRITDNMDRLLGLDL